MKIRHIIAGVLAGIVLAPATAAALPSPRLPEAADAAARKFKKRITSPDIDSTNTSLCSVAGIYMENGFCMFNLLFAPEVGELPTSADFYLITPETGKRYRTKKVGTSHVVASKPWHDGRLYAAIAFEGMPEATRLVDLYLAGLGTHLLGIHLDADGSGLVSRGPIPDPRPDLPDGIKVERIYGRAPTDSSAVGRSNKIAPPPAPPTATAGAGTSNKIAPPDQSGTPTGNAPAEDVFSSPDISLYDAAGHVKSITLRTDGSDYTTTVSFTAAGRLSALDGTPVGNRYTVKRDAKGRITSLTNKEESYDGSHDVTSYTWRKDDLPATSTWESPEGESTTTYTYDAKGRLTAAHTEGFQGDTVDDHYTYSYEAFDERGNWTVRRVTWRDAYDNTNACVERRTLTYYE